MSFFYPAEGNNAVASGDGSVAAIQSTVTQGDGILAAKVSLLEKLLEEKERTIQILMKK